MVNNAGIVGTGLDDLKTKPGGIRAHETSIEEFDLIMNVNVRGTLLGCKYSLAQFLTQEPLLNNYRGERTRGNIINMASIGGLVALGGGPSYTCSKTAVIGLTKQ